MAEKCSTLREMNGITDHIAITLVMDAAFSRHDTGGGDHPEVPERLHVIRHFLEAHFPEGSVSTVSPRPATREELLRFHTEGWLCRFEEAALSGRSFIDHPDNQVCYDSFEIAMLAAGSGPTAIDLVENGVPGPLFCCVRPPGHHAEPNMPLGFCFFNNCVIAVRYWQQRYGRQRICILDFDAHHGNGIQAAVDAEAETLYISLHEHPSFSFPGTGWAEDRGSGAGLGAVLNIPLPPGSGDDRVLAAMDVEITAALEEFRPDAFVIAAGFDGHRKDDMSGLSWSTGLYRQIGRRLAAWSREYAASRMISILEGGYHLSSLAASVGAYLEGLLGADSVQAVPQSRDREW